MSLTELLQQLGVLLPLRCEVFLGKPQSLLGLALPDELNEPLLLKVEEQLALGLEDLREATGGVKTYEMYFGVACRWISGSGGTGMIVCSTEDNPVMNRRVSSRGLEGVASSIGGEGDNCRARGLPLQLPHLWVHVVHFLYRRVHVPGLYRSPDLHALLDRA